MVFGRLQGRGRNMRLSTPIKIYTEGPYFHYMLVFLPCEGSCFPYMGVGVVYIVSCTEI